MDSKENVTSGGDTWRIVKIMCCKIEVVPSGLQGQVGPQSHSIYKSVLRNLSGLQRGFTFGFECLRNVRPMDRLKGLETLEDKRTCNATMYCTVQYCTKFIYICIAGNRT